MKVSNITKNFGQIMKIYNPLCLLAIGLFLSIYSQATIHVGTLDWGNTVEKDGAYISYRKDYDPEISIRSINLSIGHSINGEQRFYIDSFNTQLNAKCNIRLSPEVITMIFNGQAVKMARSCNSFFDADNTYYSYTPATEKGHSFVVNLFKTSTYPIELIFDGDNLRIPVQGFIKVWNSAGGNAI